MSETMAMFQELLRENNMMLTPASLFRVNPRTLAMKLRAFSVNNQRDSGTSRETTWIGESSVKSEGTLTTVTSTEVNDSIAELSIWSNNENTELNDGSATANSERTTSVTSEHRTMLESSITALIEKESSNILHTETLISNEITEYETSPTEEAVPKSSKEHSKDDENAEDVSLTSSFTAHATETDDTFYTNSSRFTSKLKSESTEERYRGTNDGMVVTKSIFTEDRYGYTADGILSSEVNWNKVDDTAYNDDSDPMAEIKATNNYIDNINRTKREAIINETISPSYPHGFESGLVQTSDAEEVDDTEINQGSELSMHHSDQFEGGDQSYPLGMSSYLEEDSLSTFWDTSSVLNPNVQPPIFSDSITSSQNNPSSRLSGSFLLQPSETMIGSQSTLYVGYNFNPDSTGRTAWTFNGRMSPSPDQTMSFMSPNQHEFSSYFNVMGTVQGSDLAQSLQSFSNGAPPDSSHFFVYSLDDMRHSQDFSPTQTFSFNAAASSSSQGDTYFTGFALPPGSTIEQHFPESATPRYHSDFPRGRPSDSAFNENWRNSISSAKLPLPTETNLFSEQEFPTGTPELQTITPTNSKPNPTPSFQIPTIGGSCSRDYSQEVFSVLRAIENMPQTHFCNCEHFVCKIPPPPVLPPRPPPFYRKPSIKYMLTKILYKDFVRKRGIMWEQAVMWDHTNVTHCP